MSKKIVFALSLLLSAAASAMDLETNLPTFTSNTTISGAVKPVPGGSLDSAKKAVKEVPGKVAKVAQKGKEKIKDAASNIASKTNEISDSAKAASKGILTRMSAPFVWVGSKTKNGVLATKDGIVNGAIAVKNAPGQYIQWCKNDPLRAGLYTTAAIVVVGGISYVAYNCYKQKQEEKKRVNELLNQYE